MLSHVNAAAPRTMEQTQLLNNVLMLWIIISSSYNDSTFTVCIKNLSSQLQKLEQTNRYRSPELQTVLGLRPTQPTAFRGYVTISH